MHVFDVTGVDKPCSDARYTLPCASPEQYAETAAALGVQRHVLVQPSYYGTDNRYLLQILASQTHEARGVVLLDERVAADDLATWSKLGVRGLRLDCFKWGAANLPESAVTSRFREAGALAKALGWSIDLYIPGRMLLQHLQTIVELPVPVSIAHMGYLTHAEGVTDVECEASIRTLAKAPSIYVKLTGAVRYGIEGASRAQQLAAGFVREMPDRLLWGSDWPHVMCQPQDSGALLDQLSSWCPDSYVRKMILVDNPAKLYDFI